MVAGFDTTTNKRVVAALTLRQTAQAPPIVTRIGRYPERGSGRRRRLARVPGGRHPSPISPRHGRNSSRHPETVRHAEALAASRGGDHHEAIVQLGEGWVGEEALAIGLYSAMVASDFREAVRIASNHGGDSDSTASIAGQIHGAWKGLEGIPNEWIRRLDAIDPLLDVAGAADPAGDSQERIEPSVAALGCPKPPDFTAVIA